MALYFETKVTPFVSHAILGLRDPSHLAQFAKDVRASVGEPDFEMLELSLQFAELGLFEEAGKLVQAVCIDAVPAGERSFLPLHYLAWFAAQRGDATAARQWLKQAAETHRDRVFASRVEEVDILRYAVHENPADAQAHLQLGCLLANLGRVEEATDVLGKIWFVTFLDFGNLWRQVGDFQLKTVAAATGLGFRYDTLFGPFRIDWGLRVYNPMAPAGQQWISQKKLFGQTFKEGVFHFGIGHAF